VCVSAGVLPVPVFFFFFFAIYNNINKCSYIIYYINIKFDPNSVTSGNLVPSIINKS